MTVATTATLVSIASSPSPAAADTDPVVSPTTPAYSRCVPDPANLSNPSVAMRCVYGVAMKSRGRINPACFNYNHGLVYRRGECFPSGSSAYTGAEYIAQARFISQMSTDRGDQFIGQVSPNVEWETTISGASRLDVLLDARDGGPNPWLVEMKGSWLGGRLTATEAARLQVSRYRTTLAQRGIATSLYPQGAYYDSFLIRCKDSTSDSRVTVYSVEAVEGGVLLIKPGASDCGGREQTKEQDQTENNYMDGSLESSDFAPVTQADPHMTTIDGLRYDLQSVGEFKLAKSPGEVKSLEVV